MKLFEKEQMCSNSAKHTKKKDRHFVFFWIDFRLEDRFAFKNKTNKTIKHHLLYPEKKEERQRPLGRQDRKVFVNRKRNCVQVRTRYSTVQYDKPNQEEKVQASVAEKRDWESKSKVKIALFSIPWEDNGSTDCCSMLLLFFTIYWVFFCLSSENQFHNLTKIAKKRVTHINEKNIRTHRPFISRMVR